MNTSNVTERAAQLINSIDGLSDPSTAASSTSKKVSDVFRSSLQEFQKTPGSLEDKERESLLSKLREAKQLQDNSSQGIIARVCSLLASIFRTSTQDLIDETIAGLVLSNISASNPPTEKMCRAAVPLINKGVSDEAVGEIFMQVMDRSESEQTRIFAKTASLITSSNSKTGTLKVVAFLKANPSLGIVSYLGDFGDSWFLRDAKSVLEEGIPPEQVQDTLHEIKDLSFWHRKSICEGTKSLIQAGTPKDNVVNILQKISTIPAKDRKTVVQGAKELIQKGMSLVDILWILEVLYNIPKADRANVVQNTQGLIKEGMNGHEISSMLYVLRYIPKKERASVAQNVKELTSKATGHMRIADILDTLKCIHKKERASISQSAQGLITEGMGTTEIEDILNALYGFSEKDRASVSQNAQGLITEGMGWAEIDNTLLAVHIIPKEAKEYNSQEFPEVIKKICQTLEHIYQTDRTSIVQNAKELITTDMDGGEISCILAALKDINQTDRTSIVQNAKELITTDMDGDGISCILTALKDIDQTDRTSIVQNAKELITTDMDGEDVSEILIALSNILTTNRTRVLRLAILCMNADDTSDPKNLTSKLIRFLKKEAYSTSNDL